MKIVEINTVRVGSTGKIMLQIAEAARSHGHEVYTFSCARHMGQKTERFHGATGSFFGDALHRILAPIVGREGIFSYFGTKRFIKKLKKIDPDVIHLHNLHGYYVNLPLLFKYTKESNKKVVWTLHDCWAFTGHCPYFTFVGCEKWKDGCHHCPQPRMYPQMYLDASKWMYKKKKQWFSDIRDMTIVTPSQWLSDLVKESFLKDYPTKVINNGIDLEVFKPTESDFRETHGIAENEKIILGVAFGWGVRKGLDIFIELSKRLDTDKYKIVLVGTDETVDAQLPKNIISIHRTHNQTELAQIYATADVFVNPTREDNYPTVNMEALACGTPVLTFRTGGSPEMLDEHCGMVVPCEDIDAMEQGIIRICEEEPFLAETCRNKAKEFDKRTHFEEYVNLYEDRTHSTECTIQ